MDEPRIPYYEDMSRISNSNIGWFLTKGPLYLRNMLDGKEEGISSASLTKGTMIHAYLLQNEEFWNMYKVIDFKVPTSKQQKDFCVTYTELLESEPFLTTIERGMKAYNKAYSNKKSDSVIEKEIETLLEDNKDYLDFLLEKDTRELITFADVNMLKNIEKNVKAHKLANTLLFNTPDTTEAHNEFHINWEYNDKECLIPVKCKSLIDRVNIDWIQEKITLIDIKTTVDIYDFKHSVELYDYYRQLAYYIAAITWYATFEKKVDISNFKLEVYIIAIQNNNSNEVRVFDMNNETELISKKQLISQSLQDISYHIRTNNWRHTRKYYENDGSETL